MNTLTSNNAIGNWQNGFLLEYSNSNNLTNNNATSNAWSGFFLGDSNSNNLKDNTATGNTLDGFGLSRSSYNNLTNNNAISNTGVGFSLISSISNNLAGNNASDNTHDGFRLESSGYNNLTGNNATGNSENGFYLSNSYSTTLTSNTATGNHQDGFGLEYSNSNTLTGNNITYNPTGLSLTNSQNNVIYNNYFNNTANLGFSGSYYDNVWNTTFSHATDGNNIVGGPSFGGNYWGYPNGTGPSDTRTDPNNDGINRTNVDLGNGNFDYLPLVRYTPAPGVLPYWIPLNTSGGNPYYYEPTFGQGYWVANLSGHGWFFDFTGPLFSTNNGFALLINQSQTVFDGKDRTLSGNNVAGYGIIVNNQTAANYNQTSLGELNGVSVTNVTVIGFTQSGIWFNEVNGSTPGPGSVASNITNVIASNNGMSGIALMNSRYIEVSNSTTTGNTQGGIVLADIGNANLNNVSVSGSVSGNGLDLTNVSAIGIVDLSLIHI